MIRERIDKILDGLPDEDLEEVYWVVQAIKKNYLFRNNLLDKGVIISEIYDEAQDIIEKWDDTFARNISQEVKETIYYSQFKWHTFSYEKQDCMKKDDARRAFDLITKSEVFAMYQNTYKILHFQNANNIRSTDFDSEQDIYIFDTDFNWTYVHTHEDMCGPYFYKVNKP